MLDISMISNKIIVGRTINDVWRDSLWCAVREGYDYKVMLGSYEGQIRKQLDRLTIEITEPWTRPLSVFMPEGTGIPAPTSEASILDYFFKYLASDYKSEGHDYTYGNYIQKQLPKIIEKLSDSKGATNQATISVGCPESVSLSDPPCLRVVDFKVVDGRLDLTVFFRSWDLFAGLPENLGGLQLFKEYVLCSLDFPVEDGKIFAYSSGAHIYEQYFPIVNTLNIDQIRV